MDVKQIRENALLAFWEVVAKSVPEAKTGDFPPDLTMKLNAVAEQSIAAWIRYNAPTPYEAIAEQLRNLGFADACTAGMGGGIICVCFTVGKFYFTWGTANDTWGSDIYIGDEFQDGQSVDTTVSTTETDTAVVAKAIAEASKLFAERSVANG